jgi:hypothetical protein
MLCCNWQQREENMKNEKSISLIEALIDTVPEQEKAMYREIAEFALRLGYKPQKVNKEGFTLDFINNTTRKKILKLAKDDIRLKFYANDNYSQKFQDGIKKVIEDFGGKYTGCYGCGRCDNGIQGYDYQYPNGKVVFRCGSELIGVKGITVEDIPEIKQLMKTQDAYIKKKSSGV